MFDASSPENPIAFDNDLSLFCLRLFENTGASRTNCAEILALQAMPTANRLHSSDGVDILWIEPSAYLLMGKTTHTDRMSQVAESVRHIGMVTDISSALIAIRLYGNNAPRILAAGCPLSFSPESFKQCDAVASHFNEIPVRVIFRETDPHFTILCDRSHGQNLVALLRYAVDANAQGP